MAASLHVTGDLRPGGRFTASRLPTPLTTVTVTVAGVEIDPESGTTEFVVPPSAATGAPIVVSDGAVTREFDVASRLSTTWVIPLVTQSNAINVDADSAAWHASVRFAGLDARPFVPGSVVPYTSGGTGPFTLAKAFAAGFLADHPDDFIVFVPSAIGGTGFADDSWNPGDVRYNNMIARVNGVLFGRPEWRLRCVLCQGFEADAGAAMPALDFRSALESFVAGLRADLIGGSPALPIIFGELADSNVGGVPAKVAIRDECLSAPTRIAYSAVASSRTPTVLATSDGSHFTLAAAAVMGARHYAALAAADANTLY